MSTFGHFNTYCKFFMKPHGDVLISCTLEGDLLERGAEYIS